MVGNFCACCGQSLPERRVGVPDRRLSVVPTFAARRVWQRRQADKKEPPEGGPVQLPDASLWFSSSTNEGTSSEQPESDRRTGVPTRRLKDSWCIEKKYLEGRRVLSRRQEDT